MYPYTAVSTAFNLFDDCSPEPAVSKRTSLSDVVVLDVLDIVTSDDADVTSMLTFLVFTLGSLFCTRIIILDCTKSLLVKLSLSG